jgi:hypothetical protein
MDKLQLEPLDIEPLDTGALSIIPLDEEKEKASIGENIYSSFADVGNTVDKAWSGLAGALAGMFDQDEADDIYKNLQDRVKTRQQMSNPQNKERSFSGKVGGALATLPMQMLSFPLSPFETGQTMIDKGETLPRALAGTGIDTVGNMVGVALPGNVGKTLPGKIASGAAINAAQDTAVRAGISSMAQNPATQEALGPSLESAAISGLIGGGLGALGGRSTPDEYSPTQRPVETPVEPSRPLPGPTEQLPLLDLENQGLMANPYGANIGDWRIDENGVPVRIDLSMDLQNVQEPLQMHLWGDEAQPRIDPIGQAATLADGIRQFEEQPMQGGIPLTQAIDMMPPGEARTTGLNMLRHMVEPSGELQGAIAEANRAAGSARLPSMGTWNGEVKQDSPATPIAPETILAKTERAQKASAIGLENTPYHRVATREEALAGVNKSTDMSAMGASNFRSGTEAVVRTNVKNKPLNYVRNVFQEGRNAAERLSKEYITAPKTGLVATIKALSPQEKADLAGVLKDLSDRQLEFTPELAQQLHLTPKQIAAAEAAYKALEARYVSASDAMMSMGFEPFKPRKGYMPAMFDGAYLSFIGKYDKDGKFITTGIAQSDTAWGLKKAVEKYKSLGPDYQVELKQPKRQLKEGTIQGKSYNGFNDLVARLAEIDPKFADAKKIVDQHTADQVKALYRYDVHELKKNNVKGSLGDRPWLSKRENADQFFDAIIDYAEQGYRYDSMQKPLNELGALVSDPKMNADMPNTVTYLNKYKDHITGHGLNAVGALSNSIVNKVSMGFSPRLPTKAVQALANVSSSLMMGFFNIGFAGMQLTQYLTSGVPEAMAIRASLGLEPEAVSKTMALTGPYTALMALGKRDLVPPHLAHAYDWAHKNGMFDYSEAELAHEVNKSKGRIVAGKIINAPIIYSEKMTRPPLFMAFVDMFNKAGYKGEDALLRAQEATDYAMVNYHADERPGIYQAMGSVGQMLGALTTYKHNFIEQQTSRIINAKQHPAALAATLGMVFGLYGIAGMAGYQELSQISEELLGKSIRELIMEDPTKSNALLDGVASWYSGIDIQSRLSQSSMFPDSPLSAAPHVANTARILGAAVEAGKNRDEASWNKLASAAMPTSARHIFEDTMLTDEQGNVRDFTGKLKTEQPRNEAERTVKRVTGMAPLRERIDRDTLWTQRQRSMDNQQKMKDLSKQFEAAIVLGGDVNKLVQEYATLGGDPQQLLSRIPEIIQQANMTPKQRAQGVPSGSLQSLQRFNEYNP